MTQETKDKIIELALQGYTSKEIAIVFPGISEDVISTFINSYHKSEKKEDQEIYDKILMARNLRNKEIIDYDVVEEMIKLIEQGFTFLEIGLLYEKGETEVRELLYKVLHSKYSIYQDKELYQKLIEKQNDTVKNKFREVYHRLKKLKQEGNFELKNLESSALVNRFQKYQAVIDLVQEYIDYNGTMSAQALATKYQMDAPTVRGILNGSLYREITLPMLGEERMKSIKEQNLQYSKDTLGKEVRLFDHITRAEKDILEKIENNKRTWIQMMLTFRLSIKDIAILNEYPETKLYALKNVLCNNNSKQDQNALDYLLDYYIPNIHPDTSQERKNAVTFQNTLSMLRSRNAIAYKAYAGRLSDEGYKNVLKKKVNEYTYDDYMIIIDYLLKYALYPEEVGLTKETIKQYASGDRRAELEILWQYQERKEEQLFKK